MRFTDTCPILPICYSPNAISPQQLLFIIKKNKIKLQIDFSVCTSISHLLPCILLRHLLCQAGHLCVVPATCGSILAAGSCRSGSHPALWYLSSCLTSLSHLLILHMFAGEGEPACKDRYLEGEQTYPSAKPHDLCGHCLTQLLLTVRKEKLQSSFRL